MKTGRIITLWATNPRPYDALLLTCNRLSARYPHRRVSLLDITRAKGGLVTGCVKIVAP